MNEQNPTSQHSQIHEPSQADAVALKSWQSPGVEVLLVDETETGAGNGNDTALGS